MMDRAAPFVPTRNWVFAGIVLGVLWFGFNFIISTAFTIWSESRAILTDPTVFDSIVSGSTPAAVRWNLALFAIYIALLLICLRVLHGLNWRPLIGPLAAAWQQFWRVSIYLMPLYAVIILPSLFLPEALPQHELGAWLLMLPVLMPLLFVQIGAEELVFRGYLQSHLAALSKSPFVWMVVPSVLFGLIHFDPYTPSYSAWSYVVWATCLGLVCADVTARSGTLGPALAIHFVNNFGALFLLAADDWLYGAALFIWPTYGQPWEPWIPYEALMLFTVWLTARLAIGK